MTDQTAERFQTDEEPTQLKRAIGPALLFFFILGDMLGGGIYALVGEVGAEVGGAIWSAFLAAFVLASLTAFAYVELASKYPRAAGAALYVNRAFKQPFFTFMVAFTVMCSGITSAGALAIAFSGDYFKEFIDLPVVLVALGFILVIAVFNAIGISESVKMNALFTCIEVFGLLLIIVIGLAALGTEQADFSRNFEFSGDGSPALLVIAGASLAFYALIGFEDSVNVAEEVRHPAKSYPIALFGGLLAAGIIYMLVTMTASAVVPTQQLAESDGPLLEVVKQAPLSIPTTLFSAIALFALFNGALINMIMASRLVYGMAEEGIVPALLGKVSPQRQTPFVAIVFTTVIAAALVLTGNPRRAGEHHGRAAARGLCHRQRQRARAAQRARRARSLRRADLHPRPRRHRQRGHGHAAHLGHLPARRHPARRRGGAVVRQPGGRRRHQGPAGRRQPGRLSRVNGVIPRP